MNAEVKELVKDVKDLFQNFQIDEGAILKPTPEFMIRFYTHLLSEFQVIVADALRMPLKDVNLNNELLEPEEIYRQISQIASKESLKFNLGDIYQPTFVRAKNFMRICLHFLSFSFSILEDIEMLSVSVLEMKENTTKLMTEKQEIFEKISKNAVTKADLLEEDQKLVHELKLVKKLHEEMLNNKMGKETIYEDLNKQIAILTQEIENEETMLEKEQATRRYLVEQTITESEYNNMLQMLNSLQNDLVTANEEEAHVGELLSTENEMLKHLEDCRKSMPEITDFNLEPIQKLIQAKEQVNDLNKETEKLVNSVNSLNQEVELAEDKLKRTCEALKRCKTENEEVNSRYIQEKEEMLQKNLKLRKQVEEKFKANQLILNGYENQLMKQNNLKEKLTLLLQQEFSRIIQTEQMSMEEFIKVLYTISATSLNKIKTIIYQK